MRGWTWLLRPSINWLLVFIPVSLLADLTHQPLLTFITAALAIVPLAGLIGRATDQLAIRVGPQLGGLLNATFGNLTELIVAVLLIAAGNFEVVKASLSGPSLATFCWSSESRSSWAGSAAARKRLVPAPRAFIPG